METESANHPSAAQPVVPAQSAQARIGQAMLDLKSRGDAGAGWFYYVAVLSLVNTAMMHGGAERTFAIGLGITLVMDAIATVVGKNHPELATTLMITAICFSVVISGVAMLIGWLSRKRYLWIFACGTFFYLCDGVIYLLIGDYFSLAFHAYALYGMIQGFRAYRQLQKVELALENASSETLATEESGK